MLKLSNIQESQTAQAFPKLQILAPCSLGVFWWFSLHFVLLCSLYLERVQRRPNKHRLISNFGPDTPPQYFVSFSVSFLKIRDRPAKNPISVPLPQKKIMNNEISILKKKQIVTN